MGGQRSEPSPTLKRDCKGKAEAHEREQVIRGRPAGLRPPCDLSPLPGSGDGLDPARHEEVVGDHVAKESSGSDVRLDVPRHVHA